MSDERRALWSLFFDEISRSKGDREETNDYLSVGNFRRLRADVMSVIGDLRGGRILDVGCGTGHFSRPLAAANTVVGLDLSASMLAFARRKGLAPVRALAEALPFADGRFDVVLATSVLQFITDGGAVVREILRVVKPGGRVIVCTTNAEHLAMGLLRLLERDKYRRFRLYPYREVAGLVRAAGGIVRAFRFPFYPFGRTWVVPGGTDPGPIPRRLGTTLVVVAIRPPAAGGEGGIRSGRRR